MRQLATLLALAAALAAAPSGLLAAQQQTLEGTALVLTKDYYTVAPVRERYVVVGSGRSTTTVKVEGEAAKQLRTGMKVRVTGRRVAGGGLAGSASAGGTATPSFQATAVQITAQPRPLPRGRSQRAAPAAGARGLLQAGLPTEQLPVMRAELNTLFLPISFEGCARSTGAAYAKPWYTDADVEKTVFGGGDGASLADMYGTCSHNRTSLTRANSRVAPVLRLPCTGTSPYGNSYNAAGSCGYGDFQGWAEAAVQAAAAAGINVASYFFKVIIIPEGTRCGWAGLGYVGCDGSFMCASWVASRYFLGSSALSPGSVQVAMHEQGHNLYLHHAASYDSGGATVEYGDWSCAMGYCCADRCFNTAHAWQLGWVAPQVLDSTSLPAGGTANATIAAQTHSPNSGLKIKLSSWAAADNIYLGYRLAEDGDATLGSDYRGRVNVYQYSGTGPYDADSFTYWLGSFAAGQTFTHAKAPGLVLRASSLAAGAAKLTVCRKSASGAETADTCLAGLDGDCDGLVGLADSDCARFMAPPPSPRPPPLSPPPPSPPASPPPPSPAPPSPASPPPPSPPPSPEPSSPPPPSPPSPSPPPPSPSPPPPSPKAANYCTLEGNGNKGVCANCLAASGCTRCAGEGGGRLRVLTNTRRGVQLDYNRCAPCDEALGCRTAATCGLASALRRVARLNLDGCTECPRGQVLVPKNITTLGGSRQYAACATCAEVQGPNCLACAASGACTTCRPGFYVDLGGACQQCTAPNCAACAPSGACAKCKTGSYMDPEGQCVPCTAARCKQCAPDGTCAVCTSGFVLNSTSKTCQTCSESGGSQCLRCSSSTGACLQCRTSLATLISATARCELCTTTGGPRCLACAARTGACLRCATEFVAVNGACQACSARHGSTCKTCTATRCLSFVRRRGS